jgi:hypothetical protein
MEKYQTPIISVSKQLSMNVKSEDITFSLKPQCGGKFVTDDKKLHTVHLYRKVMMPEGFLQRTVKD